MGHRFRWIRALFVGVIALAVGAVGYNIGVSHGLALAAPVAGAGGVPGAALPYLYYRPWRFGFGFGPLFFVLLLVFVFRPLFWGGFYRRRWSHAHPDGVPPRFEEWHRRAHAQMSGPASTPAQPESRG
jgi:hypothetical protein